jgi:hypothetical protein
VQLNNPALKATTFAINTLGVPRERINILSLGTGACIPDPKNPEEQRGIMFWAQNIATFMSAAQENEVDYSLQEHKERYIRCQPWLENPIALDAIDDESIEQLVDVGLELVEEMKSHDDNQWKRILEFVEM